jgi:predicted PurR-regulated permease PerM
MQPPGATDGIRRAGAVAWSFVGLCVAVFILGWVAHEIAVIFPPLILASALVFVLNPLIGRLNRRGVPRLAGVGLTYLAFVGFVSVLGLILFPLVQEQAENLSEKTPEIRERIERWIDDRAEDFEGTPLEFEREDLDDALGSADTSLQDQLGKVADYGVKIFHVILILILAPIFAFYLLVDLPSIKRNTEALIPEAARPEVMLIGRQVNAAVGGFFRGQLVVALIVGIMSSIALAIVDVPFWLLLGMVAGLFNIIPLVGPYIGGIPALLVALTTREPITGLWVVVAMVVVQQIDNHFISPVVMHRVVKLHPVLVMLALLLGGTLGGFFGLLVAVPATAILKIVGGHLWRVHVLGHPLDDAADHAAQEQEEPGVGVVAEVGREGGEDPPA